MPLTVGEGDGGSTDGLGGGDSRGPVVCAAIDGPVAADGAVDGTGGPAQPAARATAARAAATTVDHGRPDRRR